MIVFKQYTLTATAVALSDNTIFGGTLTAPQLSKFKQLFITNAPGAANNIFLGGSNVTNVPANAGLSVGFSATLPVTLSLGPLEVYSIDLRDIYIVGTVAGGNIAYLAVII
jgi:hypothetical protein